MSLLPFPLLTFAKPTHKYTNTNTTIVNFVSVAIPTIDICQICKYDYKYKYKNSQVSLSEIFIFDIAKLTMLQLSSCGGRDFQMVLAIARRISVETRIFVIICRRPSHNNGRNGQTGQQICFFFTKCFSLYFDINIMLFDTFWSFLTHQNHQKYQNYDHNYHSHHCRNHRYLVL